jgi:hypothetical protein
VTSLGMLGALAVGVAFGYASQRGAFCMSSGLRGVLDGEWTKVKALGLAVAIQLVLLPAAFAAGLARLVPDPLGRWPRRRVVVAKDGPVGRRRGRDRLARFRVGRPRLWPRGASALRARPPS